jgi:hypothetical protein
LGSRRDGRCLREPSIAHSLFLPEPDWEAGTDDRSRAGGTVTDHPYQMLQAELYHRAQAELPDWKSESVIGRRQLMDAVNEMLDAAVKGREKRLLGVGLARLRDLTEKPS